MAFDLMNLIIKALRVESLAYNYSNQMDQFLYLVFFPSILLLAIIYILAHRMMPEHRGISILLGVAFYIFVIVYPPDADVNLYTAVAAIGQLWYLVVIVIGIVYVLVHKILPGPGGTTRPRKFMAAARNVAERGTKEVTGKTEELRKEINTKINRLREISKKSKVPGKGVDVADLIREYRAIESQTMDQIAELEKISFAGISPFKDPTGYRKKMRETSEKNKWE